MGAVAVSDGSQVAFSWNGEKGDNRDIYVKQIGGQTPLRLTQDRRRTITPHGRPTGARLLSSASATPITGH